MAQADLGSSAAAPDSVGLGVSCDQSSIIGSQGDGTPPPTYSPDAGVPLPADFVPVAASRCVLTNKVAPGDGEWLVSDEQRADSGLDTLAAALRQPSASSPPHGVACPLIAMAPIVITLTDHAGASLIPRIPDGECGLPLPAVTSAIKDLPWMTFKETKLRQIRSQMQVDTGCSGQYKPVIAIDAATFAKTSAAPGPLYPNPPAAIVICRYRLDPTWTESAGGQSFHGGDLASGGALDGAALESFLAAANAAPPATGTCATPEAPFAILSPKSGDGPSIAVELGGCHRLLRDANHDLRQLDAATVAPLG